MTTLQQLAWHREHSHGVRVPRLEKAPKRYHKLYIALGMARFVAGFKARTMGDKIELHIELRDGEICNLVVIARLKELFKGIEGASFPRNFEKRPIIIKIPK